MPFRTSHNSLHQTIRQQQHLGARRDPGQDPLQQRRRQVFASTLGSVIDQTRYTTGAGFAAFSFRDGEIQKRSYPNSFCGQHQLKGYELVEELQPERAVSHHPLVQRTVAEVGTQIRAAHVSPDLTVACRRAEETRDEEGVEAVIDKDLAASEKFRKATDELGVATASSSATAWRRSPGPP